MELKVLSLFNGMNCIGLALSELGIKFKLYASEIDKHANKVSNALFPDTINLGDVTKINLEDLPVFDLVVAGSPCQGFSFAGKQLNFEDPRSKLFFNFVDILNHCKSKNPKLKFLLENVVMKKEYQAIISKYLGIGPIQINSALLSAQSRKRLYWTNIGTKRTNLFGSEEPGIIQPKDKGIYLKDILELEVDEKYQVNQKQKEFITDPIRIKKKYTQINGNKSICLMARYPASWNGTYIKCGRQVGRKNIYTNTKIRRLTPTECCRLQTVPNWAIEKILNCGVSDSQIYKMLGNGWTVDVIAYILSYLNK